MLKQAIEFEGQLALQLLPRGAPVSGGVLQSSLQPVMSGSALGQNIDIHV